MYRVHRNCTRCGATWSYWNNAPERCPHCSRHLPYRCGRPKTSHSEGMLTLQCVGDMFLNESALVECDKCGRTALPEP